MDTVVSALTQVPIMCRHQRSLDLIDPHPSHSLPSPTWTSQVLLSDVICHILSLLILMKRCSSITEIRRQSGVPDHHVYSSLAHPELGVLGTRISEQRLASFMMILHEPSSSNRQRRNTTWGAVPSSTHTGKVMKFNAATDVSADEEKI